MNHGRVSNPLKCRMAYSSLWSYDDQSARLAELTADTSNPDKELPLRRDVRSLGMLLGRVLVEQEGEAFYEVVERLRRLLIVHRERGSAAPTGETPVAPPAKNLPAGASHDSNDGLMEQARETISGVP